MLLGKPTLLAACSIVLSILAAPALADADNSSGDPFEGPQVFKAATPYGRTARAQVPRVKRARAARAEAKEPGSLRNVFSPFGVFPASSVVAEARRYIGTNPTKRRSLWCGTFMNMVLERTGHPRGPSDLAKSFASYGTRVSGPQVGAIAVMSRGRNGGHVGVVTGVDPNGNPIILSGNHNNRVAEAVYPRGRIIAYVMPEA